MLEVRERYDEIAAEYAEYRGGNAKYLEYCKNITGKFCSKVKGKILDAGCASGDVTTLLAREDNEIFGIDLSKELIKETWRCSKEFPDVNFYEGDMRDLQFNHDFFNGIFCFQSFLHICPEEQELVFREFQRVLQPGGVLMFNTKNLYYPAGFLSALLNKAVNPVSFGEIMRSGQTKTYRYLSRRSQISKKIKNSGFDILQDSEHNVFSNWMQFWCKKR